MTGIGNSTNIVVDESLYRDTTNKVDSIDDKMGECLYRTALEIEEMCRTIFILPQAAPRCLGISDEVKRSLGEFRALTDEANLLANRFARDINDIGSSSGDGGGIKWIAK